jgi:hypothetical protein
MRWSRLHRPSRKNCLLKSSWATFGSNQDSQNVIATAQMESPFSIVSMFYADKNITEAAKTKIAVGNKLIIDSNNMVEWATDPWQGNAKSISLLYMYQSEMRTFVCTDSQGTFTINSGPIAIAPNLALVTDHPQQFGVSNIQIIAAVYGSGSIVSSSVFSSMYEKAQTLGYWEFENDRNWFNWDPWYGTVKSGVIWYKEIDSNALIAMTGREHDTVHFEPIRIVQPQVSNN